MFHECKLQENQLSLLSLSYPTAENLKASESQVQLSHHTRTYSSPHPQQSPSSSYPLCDFVSFSILLRRSKKMRQPSQRSRFRLALLPRFSLSLLRGRDDSPLFVAHPRASYKMRTNATRALVDACVDRRERRARAQVTTLPRPLIQEFFKGREM